MDPIDQPCPACGAEPGEACLPGCLGVALVELEREDEREAPAQ